MQNVRKVSDSRLSWRCIRTKNWTQHIWIVKFFFFSLDFSSVLLVFHSHLIWTLVLNFEVWCTRVCCFHFSSSWDTIIQCLVLLRKIAGPSGESVYLYFLNGANLLKFCQKGAWPLLDWLNSKTSPCAMSSDTSYCPMLRGSCGGGYEGGVHLFTPRKTGAKRTEKGGGGKRYDSATKKEKRRE